jgi:hypothetical protein
VGIRDKLLGSYGLAVAIALHGLCPNIVLSTAAGSLSTTLAGDRRAGARRPEPEFSAGSMG